MIDPREAKTAADVLQPTTRHCPFQTESRRDFGQRARCLLDGQESAPCQELPTSQKRSIRAARSNGDIQEQRPSH
jgi:hypothetical protein